MTQALLKSFRQRSGAITASTCCGHVPGAGAWNGGEGVRGTAFWGHPAGTAGWSMLWARDALRADLSWAEVASSTLAAAELMAYGPGPSEVGVCLCSGMKAGVVRDASLSAKVSLLPGHFPIPWRPIPSEVRAPTNPKLPTEALPGCAALSDPPGGSGEADVPAKQHQAEALSRLPCPHVHHRRPQRAEASACKGSQAARSDRAHQAQLTDRGLQRSWHD